MVQFTLGGLTATRISGNEINELAKTIACLGEHGWEMVGTGARSLGGNQETNHIIYFKRPRL
jgi:hypothetical protein